VRHDPLYLLVYVIVLLLLVFVVLWIAGAVVR
jgi:hypothetical protein